MRAASKSFLRALERSRRPCERCGGEHAGSRLVDCLGRIQDLVGTAKSAYLNDRSEDRAGPVLDALGKAFDAVVSIRSGRRP